MINFLEDIINLSDYSCKDTKLFPVFQTVKFFIVLIQVSVPFALVIWGSLDWFKALIARDEKEMRIKRKPFVTRVIFAMLILVLPWVLKLISNKLADTNQFWKCYSEAKAKIDFSKFELDEDSGNLSGTTTGKKSSSSSSSSKKDENVKNNCGLFGEEKKCKNGKTSTHNCKWVKVGDGGYCEEGDKIKSKK